MQIEKWITFLILSFILLIAVFNIIGSLSMLIIEKKADISTLRSLGADESLIKRIFLLEGWFISFVGAVFGIFFGTIISLVQQHFGFLKLGKGYIVDAYPVVTSFNDVMLVFITVLIMGMFAALYPVKYINKSL
jgi:ABC-type lipoprotein release transport system permease subunit